MSSFENWKPAPSVLVVIVEAMLLKETGFFLANRQIRGRRGLTSTGLVPLPYLVVWPSTESSSVKYRIEENVSFIWSWTTAKGNGLWTQMR